MLILPVHKVDLLVATLKKVIVIVSVVEFEIKKMARFKRSRAM